MRKSLALTVLLLLTGVAILSVGDAAAQNSEPKAITIEPFLQEVILEPSDTSKTFSVQITNNTSSRFNFTLSAVDFGSLSETGGIFFSGTETSLLGSKYGLAKWVELDSSTRSLEPGQKTKVDVTLVNRSDLSPGGHYGAIFINSESNNDGSDKPKVSFKQSISALVLAIKRGGERYDLSLAGVTHNGSWLKAPDKVNLRFQSAGNTHVVPRGTVELKDGGGNVISRGIINEDSRYVLPETFRQMQVNLRGEKSSSVWPVQSRILEVSYRYDGLEQFATKVYTVRWINWQPLVLLLLGFIALFLIVNYFWGERIEKLAKQKLKKPQKK